MTQYQLTVNERQAEIVRQALELFARLQAGQFGDIRFNVPIPSGADWQAIAEASDALKAACFPGEPPGYANFNRGTANEAYDVMMAIRYRLAWDRNPAGGFGVQFDPPLYRGEEPPARFERLADT